MRRLLAAAAASSCLLAASPAAQAQGGGHAAAIARFLERAPELFRVWPEEGAAGAYAIEPRVPRLPVRLTVSAGDEENLDRRCGLDEGVLRVALENALADSGLALAGGDEPDAVELLLVASAAVLEGERCVGLVAAEARLSRRIAEAGGAAYLFEPVLYAETALVRHRPRDFPTREVEELLDRLVGAVEAAADEEEGGGPPPP
jgi:hypothetical protein